MDLGKRCLWKECAGVLQKECVGGRLRKNALEAVLLLRWILDLGKRCPLDHNAEA